MKIEKLKTLKALLGAKEVILTGSLALAYHGLLELTDCKDLDILVLNPSDTTTEVLKRLQTESPSPKFVEGGPVNYSFFYEEIKVDVWVITAHEDKEYLTTKDGIQIASIKSIVKAKLSYNRTKDWVQLMQLAKKIYDPAKFASALDGIITDAGNDYPA